MDKQQEMLCELWPEEQLEKMPHSRLYCLEPIGVGSPMVESLTSYVVRLADAHSVSPRTLVSQEIAPHLEQSYIGRFLNQHNFANPQVLSSFWRQSMLINGIAKWAEDWVHALEQLTLRKDLRFLTMLPWREVLSPFQLIQRTQNWCPVCYEDWRKAGLKIYQPLLWTLKSVSWCPIHCIPLQDQCPHIDCKRKLHPLMSQLQMGYCTWCNRWLGDSLQDFTATDIFLHGEGRQWHQGIGQVMEEMLSITPNLQISLHQNTIAEIIMICINKLASGNTTKIAHQLKVGLRTALDWKRGKTLPQLQNFLQICSFLKISPANFLTGEATRIVNSLNQISLELSDQKHYKHRNKKINVERDRNALENALRAPEDSALSLTEIAKNLGYTHTTSLVLRFPELCRAITARYRDFQRKKREAHLETIEESLKAILHSTEGPAPSLRQVAKSLGYKERFLYRHFPELCHAISTRFMDEQREKSIERIEQICEEVRQAVQHLHVQGIYPSNRKVRMMLANPALMKEPKVYICWKETLQELGLL